MVSELEKSLINKAFLTKINLQVSFSGLAPKRKAVGRWTVLRASGTRLGPTEAEAETGYARWAKTFNLKQMAEAVCFIKEQGVDTFEELSEKTEAAVIRFNELSDSIKASESRLAEIVALKKHIINYSRTKDVYTAYRKAGYSKKFLEEHREEIALHKVAKAAFDQLDASEAFSRSQKGSAKKKIPTIKQLNQEYAQVLADKKKAYAEYRTARKTMKDLLIARKTVETILEVDHTKMEQKKKEQPL